MKLDEFVDKLRELKEDYFKSQGKELETIEELEDFITKKKFRVSGRRHLKSLKGLGF
jgi:hypothetical protein